MEREKEKDVVKREEGRKREEEKELTDAPLSLLPFAASQAGYQSTDSSESERRHHASWFADC